MEYPPLLQMEGEVLRGEQGEPVHLQEGSCVSSRHNKCFVKGKERRKNRSSCLNLFEPALRIVMTQKYTIQKNGFDYFKTLKICFTFCNPRLQGCGPK